MSSYNDRTGAPRISEAELTERLGETSRAKPTFEIASINNGNSEKQNLNSAAWWMMLINNPPALQTNATNRSERDWTNFLLQYGNAINYQQLMERENPLSQTDLLQLDMNDERVADMQLYSDGRGSYYTQGMLSTGRFDVRDVELRPINARAARGEVIDAIQRASAEVGVDVDFMMRMAQQESGFNSNARAGTSSAAGLYQFINSTRQSMARQYGISADPFDPYASALMAAYYARDNARSLERSLGREINHADLYAAHFMGLGGARTFLRNLESNPNAIAASSMPEAARANRNIFYERDGTPRTNAQIYHEVFGSKFDRNDDWRPDRGQSANTTIAQAGSPSVRAASLASTSSGAIAASSDGGVINSTIRRWTGFDLGLNI